MAVEVSPELYFGAMTLLFFFWVYGIASFVLDLKNKFLPAVRQYLRHRKEKKKQKEEEREREEKKRQLY